MKNDSVVKLASRLTVNQLLWDRTPPESQNISFHSLVGKIDDL